MKIADREELAREHLPLVDTIVSRELRKLGPSSEIDTNDLRSYAMEGLASALGRWDPDRAVPFPAFATPRIRGAIYDGLGQAGWFPRRLRRKINFYRQSEEMLSSYRSEPPPEDKVEAVHRLADTLKELATAYVTSYVASESCEPPGEPMDAETAVDRKRFCEVLNRCVAGLPKKQRAVVQCYFFEDRRLPEIAERLEISTSWASKLLGTALSRLRRAYSDERGAAALDSFNDS